MTSAIPGGGPGFEIATGFLKVVADTRKAQQQTERFLRRQDQDFARAGDRAGHSFGDGLFRGFRARMGRLFGPLLAGIRKAVVGTAKLAALGLVAGTVASAIGGLVSAIAALIPMLGELIVVAARASGSLLLIPAALTALVAVVATAKIGMKGFGDALRAVASGDAKKLDEALKHLAPNARAVVRVLQQFKPTFDRLRLNVQQVLFAKMATSVRDLARDLLPVLNIGLAEMGRVLNGAVRDGIDFLVGRATRTDLAAIFRNSARAVGNLAAALRPLLSVLRDVTAVGAAMLATLTVGAGAAMDRFAEKVAELRESGGLAGIIRDGLDALKVFGAAAVDIFQIFAGLGRAAGGAGGLFSFLDRLNEIINSASGQSSLGQVFDGLFRIGQALTPVLMAVLRALIPVVDGIAAISVAFAPGLVVLATALGNALGMLAAPIAALSPLLLSLAAGLAPLAQILADVFIAATPGLTAAMDGLVALVPVAGVVGQAIGDLFELVGPFLEAMGPVLAGMLAVTAVALSALAKALTPVAKLMAAAFGDAVRRFLPLVMAFAEQALPAFADAGLKIAGAFAPLVPLVAQLVDTWIRALLPGMPQLVESFNALAQILVVFGTGMAQGLIGMLEELAPLLPDLFVAIGDLSAAFVELSAALQPLFAALMPTIGATGELDRHTGLVTIAIRDLIFILRIAAGLVGGVAAIISGFTGGLGRARSGVESFGRAVMERIGAVIGIFTTLRARITSAVGNLANLLYDAGKRVIQGLINGIKAMFPSLGSIMSGVAQLVRDYWPFSPAKRGPLSGSGDLYRAGRNIPQRLMAGVQAGLPSLAQTMAGLAGQFGAQGGAALAGAAGGIGPVAFGPTNVVVHARIGDREVETLVEEVLVSRPELVASTADEGRRLRTWHNSGRRR